MPLNNFRSFGQSIPAVDKEGAAFLVEISAETVLPMPLSELQRIPDLDAQTEAPVASHTEVPPVYHGYVRVVDYNDGAREKMVAKFLLSEADQSRPHPFKGLRWSRSAGQGHRLRMAVSQDRGGEDFPLYVGEGELAFWSEDCAIGMSFKVRFDSGPDGSEIHPLKGIVHGMKEGETVFFACWAVADDESPEKPETARRQRRPFLSLSATDQSHILCRNADFRAWCFSSAVRLFGEDGADSISGLRGDPVSYAGASVRLYCGIPSRSDFKLDDDRGFRARQLWAEMQRRFWADQPPR